MKKVFITWGGWEGHEPRQTAELFAGLLREKGASVEVVNTLEPLADAERMATFDLIIPVWTMSKIERPQLEGLLSAVRSGVGFGGWHGGAGDSFRESTDYQWLVGGQWVAHPGGVIDYTVEIVNPVDYASYVEFGHRTVNGGWVNGKYMLTISEEKLKRIAPSVLEALVLKKLREVCDV